MKSEPISVVSISKLLNLQIIGEDRKISFLNLCNRENIKENTITYIVSDRFIPFILNNNNFRAVFITEDIYFKHTNSLDSISCLLTENPETDFYRLHEYLVSQSKFYKDYNFITQIGSNLKIGNNVIIDEKGVIIGDNVTIESNSIIKSGTCIGNDCFISSNVIIGCDGFQLIKNLNGINSLISHAGGVQISKNVFLGNNSVVSKGLFRENTFIGKNTKIDNFVHISHNCIIGNNCVITGGSVLSGSVRLDDGVWLGPNSTVLNKVICGENSIVGIGSVVLNNIESNSKVYGNPARKFS